MPGTKLSAFTCLCVCFSLALSSCSDRGAMARLSDIESYIDSRPDSALAAIRQIDTTALKRREAKAKYSLLHAIALDKNYIDTADTRIVQPAVDWYSRHGSPEEKLKAWMYLGIEQYNNGQYNRAIVSFNQATDLSDRVDDQNLLGILYSRIADTFTKTMDFSLAESYIARSLDCFRLCGREDQEGWEKLREAKNKAQLRKWEEADSCFLNLLSGLNGNRYFQINVELDYALFLLSSPISRDSAAIPLLEKNRERIMNRNNFNLKGAYAYALSAAGYQDQADSLMKQIKVHVGDDNLFYQYWQHRILKSNGDYKNAYYQLWAAQRKTDSLSVYAQSESAAMAQREYNEQVLLNNRLKNRNLLLAASAFLVLLVVTTVFSIILFRLKQKKMKGEIENMSLIIESLENQVFTLNEGRKDDKSKINMIQRDKTKARFEYLSELVKVFHNNQDELDYNNLRNVYYTIKSKVGDLNSDERARTRFEARINEESDDIMRHFREDFPELPEESIRLASFVFAGFDNTTISLLIDETSTNTRTLKYRLMKKILSSSATHKDDYLNYFPRKK